MKPVEDNDQSQFDLPSPTGGASANNSPPSSPGTNPIVPPPSASPSQLPSSPPKAVPSRPALPTGRQAHQAGPPAAEDSDLIEQEWVDKAKAIVEHTKDDPFKQTEEMNKMKADYIRKRYQKDIRQTGE